MLDLSTCVIAELITPSERANQYRTDELLSALNSLSDQNEHLSTRAIVLNQLRNIAEKTQDITLKNRILEQIKPFRVSLLGLDDVEHHRQIAQYEKTPEEIKTGRAQKISLIQAIAGRLLRLKLNFPTLWQLQYPLDESVKKQSFIENRAKEKTRDFLHDIFGSFIINKEKTEISGIANIDKVYELANDPNNIVTITCDHQGRLATMAYPFSLYTQDLRDGGNRYERTAIHPRESLFDNLFYRRFMQFSTMVPVQSPYQDIPLISNKEVAAGIRTQREGQIEAANRKMPCLLFPEGGTPRIVEEFEGKEYSVLLPFWGGIGSMFSDLSLKDKKSGSEITKKRWVCPQAVDNSGNMWSYTQSLPTMYFQENPKEGVVLRASKPLSSEDLDNEAQNGLFDKGFEIYSAQFKSYIFRQIYGQIRDSFCNALAKKDMVFRKSDTVKKLLVLLNQMESLIQQPDFYQNTDDYIAKINVLLQSFELGELGKKDKNTLTILDQSCLIFDSVFNSKNTGVKKPTKQEFSVWIRTAAMLSPAARGKLGRECLKSLSPEDIAYLKTQLPEDCQEDEWLLVE